MFDHLERLEMLCGSENISRLENARVAVFGVGGVGGYVCEALARSGIGALDVFDNDTVALSNLNRQIISTRENIGMKKVEAQRQRILSINPECKVTMHDVFYAPDNADETDLTVYDYVVDAVDFVPAKLELAVRCEKLGVAHISAMGAGNKLHPEMLEIADIYKTSVCPLARVMRRELKKRGVRSLKCVYSKEQPIVPKVREGEKLCPSSTAFVPSAAGLIIASQVVQSIIVLPKE